MPSEYYQYNTIRKVVCRMLVHNLV
jgi:hypothetical protein